MVRSDFFNCAIAGLFVLALGAKHALAQQSYAVVSLGTLDQNSIDGGRDINNSGQVALIRNGNPYTWQNGVATPIPGLAGCNGPMGINNLGHLAVAVNGRPYFYHNGIVTDLGLYAGQSAYAGDINIDDVIVGNSNSPISGRPRGLIWKNGTVAEVPGRGPGGTYGTGESSQASAINDSGQIVGTYNHGMPNCSAMMWQEGVAVPLPNSPGFSMGWALDINNSGVSVGYCTNSAYSPTQAVMWSGGAVTPLGTLPGYLYAQATAINSAGVIVGDAENIQTFPGEAFVWSNGQMRNLNALIAPGSGWILKSALSINDSGQIVGYGYKDNVLTGFLLNPVPAPGASVIGFTALAMARRRRLSAH